MYGRSSLDRFKKAQSLEPFSVSNSNSHQYQNLKSKATTTTTESQQVGVGVGVGVGSGGASGTQVGGSQSSWQPPDWAIEPRPGVHFLEVLKEGQVLDCIPLDKRRHLFGRQFHTCDFVLDHQSVSRQHAAVVPHKNGSVYVIDLGSAHGTFVANERLVKDSPVELEVGQSLRFAASTRTYILRKNEAALFPPTPAPTEINLPPPPDPSDDDAVVAYNTLLNRYGITKSDLSNDDKYKSTCASTTTTKNDSERASKKMRRTRVTFKDQVGGDLVEVVGVSDGADVETEPGPLGLKEGSLVGKYESLVQVTVIPKGKSQKNVKEDNVSQKGVSDKLQEVLNKVKSTSTSKTGFYDDLYGESFSVKVGTSWAGCSAAVESSPSNTAMGKATISFDPTSQSKNSYAAVGGDDDDDLFGD